MKILVAGAGGYIGVPLCSRLLSEGHVVIAIDTFYFGEDKIFHLMRNRNFLKIKEDIREIDSRYFKGVDIVFDLAGLSNDTAADQFYIQAKSINYAGCLHLADLSVRHGVKRFIYSSSASVYGAGKIESLTESSPVNPVSKYSELKLKTEQALLNSYWPETGVTILRNPTLFGISPRMRFDLALNIMTWRSIRDGKIIIHGNGEQWRPLLSVNDVVSAFISVMEAPLDVVAGEIYNVGGKDSNIQIRELASIIASQLPNVNIEFAPKLTDQRSYHLNFDKILNRLNYHPNTSHLEGVLSIIHAIQSKKIDPGDPTFYTVDWYRKRVFPKINQNMRSDRNHD